MAFSAQLLENQLKAKIAWKKAVEQDPSKKPRINALAAVQTEVTSRIDEAYSDPEKKRTNRIFWINHRGGTSVTDGRPGCTPTFNKLDANSKAYTLTRSKTDGFANGYREYETSVFDRNEVEIEGINETQKRLFEDFNRRVHAVLNDPTNLTSYKIPGYTIDPSDRTVIIPPERWTARGMSVIDRYIAQLGMSNPYLISGNALYDILYDTKKDQGMEINIGAAARVRDKRIYVDLTMDSTLGEEKFFLIDGGTLAILNRLDWKDRTPVSLDGASRLAWGMDSTVVNTPIGLGMEGNPVNFKIDRHYRRVCVDGTDFTDHHGFNLNADVVVRPFSDNTDDAEINGGTFTDKYTGIVAFKCGTPIEGSGS